MNISNTTFELDENRGVLYVHGPKGATLLRICCIPHRLIEQFKRTQFMDITIGLTPPRERR